MLAWDITRWRRVKLERWRRRAKHETQKSDFHLRVNHSRNVRECNCLETHIPWNAIHCGRQNVTITHFVKVVTTVFPLHMAEGMSVTVLTSHGHIAELNKLGRRIRLLGNFSRLRRRLPILKQWASLVQVMCSVSWSWNKILPLLGLAWHATCNERIETNVSR